MVLQVLKSKILAKGSLVQVFSQKWVVFGRDRHMHKAEQRLRLKEVDVSRTHSSLFWRDGSWYLEDFDSKFGTWISLDNRDEVFKRLENPSETKLRHGQLFRIGSTIFKIHNHAPCIDCRLSHHPIYNLSFPEEDRSLDDQHAAKVKKKSPRKIRSVPTLLAESSSKTSSIKHIPESASSQRHSKRIASKKHIPISHKPISEANKGNQLLRSMGWVPGNSLGKGDQIVEPIVPKTSKGRRGLGFGAGP